MSKPHCVSYQGIRFERGIKPDDISRISGAGLYSKAKDDDKDACSKLMDMFDIDTDNLEQSLDTILANATWKQSSYAEEALEYLNPNLDTYRSYWVTKPVKSEGVWLARIKQDCNIDYCLYRFSNDVLEVSSLETWMVDSGYPRMLACALLKRSNKLPAHRYFIDGELVHLSLGYLLPKSELNLLMLYSWPEDMQQLDSPFKRTLNKDAFFALQSLLSHQGFTFTESDSQNL